LLDQRALAGLGNIWRTETLFAERTSPFTHVGDLDEEIIHRLVRTGRRLLRDTASLAPGRALTRVYRRAGRPCPRCGTIVRSGPSGGDIPRTAYWCPRCQPDPRP
jgi:endonuclease-8